MVVEPGGGERIGDRARILIDSEAIAVVEFDYPALRRGPDRHVHHHHGDGFLVVEGQLVFELGPEAEDVPGAPGTFVFSPPGVAHTFRNAVDAPTRFVNIHVPGCGFGDHMRGKPGFDQHDPPAGGGRSLSEAVMRIGGAVDVEHELLRAEVVKVDGHWSGAGCVYVVSGSVSVEGTELPERGFAAGDDLRLTGQAAILHLQPR